ncbi:glycosyltransferase family protein [Calycomorphotria hydatis]|uniref:Glycosyl transferases group 1 n=1 Tax=Calycomorphotria hydatis TaxID=2528027 RepID=A0A517TDK8_9PLAN|nr:glycosyltransferase family 4 protein [Calycomorphotria hydatis]QDT66452.1 hypothetical protein V22_37190 [Calycomorphotria hydatis]
MKNLVIVHHHLNRGGVTRVIAAHLRSLNEVTADARPERIFILYGGRHDGWPVGLEEGFHNLHIERIALQGIDYNDEPLAESEPMADDVQNLLQTHGCQPDDTLLHIHNHSLGKNASWPGALKILAERGYRQLRQVHDFAEDFRPKNFGLIKSALGDLLSEELYPQAEHIHYSVLNRRDGLALEGAGLSRERLHFLPNPVPEPEPLPARDAARAKLQECLGIGPDEPYLLYPIRGIRRKNLGEALLLSLLLPNEPHIGITLIPVNPAEKQFHDAWQTFVERHQLRIHFGAGEEGKLSYAENLAACDAAITTSVAEGFGMAFLEPWLVGKPLIGRDLPEISADFKDEGVDLTALYDRVRIPVEWIGKDNFRDAFQQAAEVLFHAYDRPLEADQVNQAIEQKEADGCLDFADLDEQQQAVVLLRLIEQPTELERLRSLNPLCTRHWETVSPQIDGNAATIRERYSTECSGKRLIDIYDSIVASSTGQPFEAPADPHQLLDRFLDLSRFRLIRGLTQVAPAI